MQTTETFMKFVSINQLQNRMRSLVKAREFGIFAFLIAAIIIIGVLRPSFLSPNNVFNMGRQMAQITIMAVAMTFLITAQELDLSLGSTFGFCTLGMALLAKNFGLDLWASFGVAILAAVVIGFVNGFITTRGGIPSFIVTLGMLSIVRGLTLLMSPWPVSGLEHPSFFTVLAGDIGNISVQILWMIAIAVLGSLVLNRTNYGYHVRATGSNRAAALLSGIPVNRVKMVAFIIVSISAALAGALSFAHLTSISPTSGAGLELTIIAAVVIGGTNLFGGEGTVIGTVLGAALLTVMRNGVVQLGGEGRLQEAFLGAIIIIAVLIHTHLGKQGGRMEK
ncbi:ABC transporter permease [Candidatus Leptofilum sp.]|uniref:ABC transporter permease n=1 Tax=Candidatus Leptofilum sp. TaxID=3241576 RepID=UPI003B5A7129